MKRIYIAISQNCWGKGNTIADAMKQLKLHGGNCRKGKMVLLNAADGAYVDDLGSIQWDRKADPEDPFNVNRDGVRVPDSTLV